MNSDEIQTEIGEGADGVAVGKGIHQRSRRASPSASVNIGNQTDPLAPLWNEIMQVSVDLRFLTNRHAEDINRLNQTMERLHRDMQEREFTSKEYNRVTREMIRAQERSIEVMQEQTRSLQALPVRQPLPPNLVMWIGIGTLILAVIVAFWRAVG